MPGDKSDIELVGAYSPPSVFNTLGGNAADASSGAGCGLGDAAKPGNKGGTGLVATAVSRVQMQMSHVGQCAEISSCV